MGKDKADLLQGTLDMLILKSLSLGDLHGYGIIQRIRQLSDEMLNVEQGSLTLRSIALNKKAGCRRVGTNTTLDVKQSFTS